MTYSDTQVKENELGNHKWKFPVWLRFCLFYVLSKDKEFSDLDDQRWVAWAKIVANSSKSGFKKKVQFINVPSLVY